MNPNDDNENRSEGRRRDADDDDRPVRKRRDSEDDEDRPVQSRRDHHDDDDDDRPRRRRPDFDDDDDDDDRPRRRRRDSRDIGDDPTMRMIMPVGLSGWAIVAGYMGLFSVLCLPAPIALITGIIAIRDIKRNPKKHGMGRATFGIVMGAIGTITMIGFGIKALLDQTHK